MGFCRLAIHGNLTREPEVRQVNETRVCTFTVACNVYKGKDKQDEVQFVRVSAWRGLADVCSEWLHKGDGVIAWGKVTVHAWTDKQDGSARGALELDAEGIDFAEKRAREAAADNARPTEMVPADDDDELPF